MKSGTFVTTIFAKHMVNLIDALTIGLVLYPNRFAGDGDCNIRYECKIENCHRETDGRWVTNNKTARNGRDRAPVDYTRFFWRIEPNYSPYGKPFFSDDKIAEIFRKSETKKVIHQTGRHSVCLEWFKFDPPTDVIWGLTPGPVYVTVYDRDKCIWTGKKPINERGWRKEFISFIEEYFRWDPTRKD